MLGRGWWGVCPRGLAASHEQHTDGASLSPQHLRDPHGLGLGHERGDSTETGLREVDGGGGVMRGTSPGVAALRGRDRPRRCMGRLLGWCCSSRARGASLLGVGAALAHPEHSW